MSSIAPCEFLVFFALTLSSQTLWAKKSANQDWVNLSGFYSQYSKSGGNSAEFPHPAPSADIELGLRVFGVLQLVGSISNTVEPDSEDPSTAQFRIRTEGGGLKFDLPGFFLIGAQSSDFKKWMKSRPINTFLLAEGLSLTLVDVTNEQTTTATAGRFGIGIDIFPGSTLSHFTFRALYMNYSNNGYMVYSFGGGVTF